MPIGHQHFLKSKELSEVAIGEMWNQWLTSCQGEIMTALPKIINISVDHD
jgi:hypothetical protein